MGTFWDPSTGEWITVPDDAGGPDSPYSGGMGNTDYYPSDPDLGGPYDNTGGDYRGDYGTGGYDNTGGGPGNTDAVAGGNGGGNRGGNRGGNTNTGNQVVGGLDIAALLGSNYNSQARIELDRELGRRRLDLDEASQRLIDVPNAESYRAYQAAQTALAQAQQAAQEYQFKVKQDWDERKFGMQHGFDVQKYDTDLRRNIWNDQSRLAQQNAQMGGLYVPPAAEPELPYHYQRDQFIRDFRAHYGRNPSTEEIQAGIPWRSTGAEQPSWQPSESPQNDQAQLDQTRRAIEQKAGRRVSDAEWNTWLTGRFDPNHPYVQQGKVQAGSQLSAMTWGGANDEFLSMLPDSARVQRERNTGQSIRPDPGQPGQPVPLPAPGRVSAFGGQPGESIQLGGNPETGDQEMPYYGQQRTGAGGIAGWQDQGLNAAQRAGLTGTRGAPPMPDSYAALDATPEMQAVRQAGARVNAQVQQMRAQGATDEQLRAYQEQQRAANASLYEAADRVRSQYGSQQMSGGVQIGQEPGYGAQQPRSRFGGSSGYNYEGPTARTDPLTGRRGYVPPDQLRDFYNMTGSLPGGQTGLTGRAANLAEWEAENRQRYNEAMMAANPANYALVAAMGGRAPWQQGMTSSVQQPGQSSYPGTAYEERPQVSGAAPLTDQRGIVNPGNVQAYNEALQAANRMPGSTVAGPQGVTAFQQARTSPVPSRYGNPEGAQYGNANQNTYGVPTGRQMTSQQYAQLRPDERQAFGSAVTASQGRSLQDWEQENRRYAPNTNRAAMAAFR